MAEESAFRELMRRVRAGDEDAATELIRRYEPTIRRVARVRLGDSGLRRALDSMDICQSVFASFFVRAALGQYDLDKPEQLLHLLVDMSRKKLIDQVRKQGAARRDYRRLENAGPDLGDVVDPGPTPSQDVAARELLEEFRRRLSAEERELADERARGLDWAEIAAGRGDSPEALRKRLTRAVERVAQEVGLHD